MSTQQQSPFIVPLRQLSPSSQEPEFVDQQGPSPRRIGSTMLAIEEGSPVSVTGSLIPIGDGILAQLQVHAELHGECVRCLQELRENYTTEIQGVFSDDPSLIHTDDGSDVDAEEQADAAVYSLTGDSIDIEQLLTDAVGLELPFNPTCPEGCDNDATEVPEPDGISGEEADRVDPRWAGLEKFL